MSDIYKIYVDYGVLGYELTYPDISGCNLEKQSITRTISRTALTGTLTFRGEEYDTIKSRRDAGYNKLDIKLQEKNADTGTFEDIWEGYVSLAGIPFNESAGTCDLKISGIQDKYYNFFDSVEDNYETEYDIGELERESILYDRDINELDFEIQFTAEGGTPTAVDDWYSEWLFYNFSGVNDIYVYATQKLSVKTSKKDLIIGTFGWQDTGVTSGSYTILARKWENSGYLTVTSSVPSKGDYWNIIDGGSTPSYLAGNIYTINDTYYGEPRRVLILGEFFSLVYLYVGVFIDEYYGKDSKPLSRLFDFKGVVSELISNIDSSVIVNDAETWADFFDKTGNEEMQTLALLHAWDLSENNLLLGEYKDDKEAINPADRSGEIEELENKINRLQPFESPKISFKYITDVLQNSPLNVFWYLKESGGNTYLKFEHVTDINNSDSGTDLQNYKSINWVQYQNSVNDPTNPISRQVRSTNSLNVDHLGVDIIYYDAPEANKEETTISIITDIQGQDSIANKINDGWFLLSLTDEEEIVTAIENYSLIHGDFAVATIDSNNKIVLQDPGTSITACYCQDLKYAFAGNFKLGISFEANLVVPTSILACVVTVFNEDDTEEATVILKNTITQGLNVIETDLNLGQTFTIARASIGFKEYGNGNCSVELTETKYTYKDVERSVGEITGLTIANNSLSLANLDDKYIGNCDFDSAIVNGSVKNSLNLRLRKSQANTVDVPITPNFDSLNFDEYITSNIGKCIIQKQTRSLDGGFDKLNLMINENI